MMLAFIREFAPHVFAAGRVESVQSFDHVEAELQATLPADYKAFLMWADGGDAVAPVKWIKFYPLSELLPRRADGQPTGTLEFASSLIPSATPRGKTWSSWRKNSGSSSKL